MTGAPATTSADFIPERTHCEHCLTGEGAHFERWDWTLLLGDRDAALRLARDGIVKLTVPLTPGQVEHGPVTMASVVEGGL